MLLLSITLLVLWLFRRYLNQCSQPTFIARQSPTEELRQTSHPYRFKKKPDWVRAEVIRLKALMPGNGCRKLANQFNRLYMDTREETVSKSYVANVIKLEHYAILEKRRHFKNNVPKSIPIHSVWSTDLTQVRDIQGEVHTILGVIDNGSRALLRLDVIRTKHSIQLLATGPKYYAQTTNMYLPLSCSGLDCMR